MKFSILNKDKQMRTYEITVSCITTVLAIIGMVFIINRDLFGNAYRYICCAGVVIMVFVAEMIISLICRFISNYQDNKSKTMC